MTGVSRQIWWCISMTSALLYIQSQMVQIVNQVQVDRPTPRVRYG